MHQNTENVQAEIKECWVISAHEVNFQTSFSRRGKFFTRLSGRRNCLLTQSTRENNGRSTSNVEATTLGMQKYQVFNTQAYIFF